MSSGFLKVGELTVVERQCVPGQGSGDMSQHEGAETCPRPREYDMSQGEREAWAKARWNLGTSQVHRAEGRRRCELRAPGEALLPLRKPSPNTLGSGEAHLRDLGDLIALGEAST